MSTLLSFHKSILEKTHDPATSELLLIARGLGLRRVTCKLLQIYDSPQNLVILVNASQDEASAIGEELGVMGCRKPGLRIVGFETGRKERQELYKKGGLIAVTSQILTVDMLTSDIPTHLITGILILHAERVSPSSSEAFIVRLYREKNKSGFLKAFSDQPEHITSGMSPLRTIMKELQLRTVHIYPRFHQDISECLGRDRSVLQLTVDMTENMSEIHNAIVQCMSTTLSELKRSNTSLELDDLNVENAYFKSFDAIVRRQLDSVWHKVGPRTKQLVNDLATLRRLLNMLLSEDALSFQQYLESLIDSNTYNEAGNARQNQSPWLLTDAANVIFQYAKRRCFTMSRDPQQSVPPPQVYDVEDEDAWEALYELEGVRIRKGAAQQDKRPSWLPQGMEPVLEELPKWSLVSAALEEIEEEMMRREATLSSRDPGTNTILIMTSSLRTAELLREFLASIQSDSSPGAQGRKMMQRRLRRYLEGQAMRNMDKKGKQSSHSHVAAGTVEPPGGKDRGEGEVSAALRKKDRDKQAKAASRRRLRGGAPAVQPPRKPIEIQDDERLLLPEQFDVDAMLGAFPEPTAMLDFGAEFDPDYGLVASEQTAIVRAYSDDGDDHILSELQPRYIIMAEPNLDFVRRVEVYKKSSPGLGVRVYLMIYNLSCEEAKYLFGVGREKDAFERLIKERGSMLLPIMEERRLSENADSVIKTISTRIAGGRKEVSAEPYQVVVDMREFRSSLPSLLHATGTVVIPATLTVGDYILSPDIGRLYTQCEMMSAHYKHPILLIEWEEHRSFSLEAVAEVKSYAKPKYAAKNKVSTAATTETTLPPSSTIQSKIVLLTLTFPRLRIIWSSSPFATADIFNDLKRNLPEPDASRAVAVGAEEDAAAAAADASGGAGVHNVAAEELLRSLPGVSARNVRHVMNRVGSVREFCELGRGQMQDMLGVEPGKMCWDFIHRGDRKE
ncbi:hypothetical protein EW026_g7520 [Hermanssonia centrifuga]|uniref:ERCC4 domain-containing protein n=1 Tax=Hermanssonia centrifuga TaxID=98765 RepID=A0A4V3X9D7_9APHY|nr:hypothetical protein EW026_g7520 [Hermanssonia centrifuga]